jgi:hypothetical protein
MSDTISSITFTDPVAEIGARMKVVENSLENVERHQAEMASSSTRFLQSLEDQDALFDYLDALSDLAVSQPAKSLAGAMVQLAVVARIIDLQRPCGERTQTERVAERRCKLAFQSIMRLLSQESGIRPEQVGADYFAPPDLPDRFETALAARKEATHSS